MKTQLFIKKTAKSVVSVFIAVLMLIVVAFGVGWTITMKSQQTALTDCSSQMETLLDLGFIYDGEYSQQEIETNCITLPSRARAYLDSLGGKDIPLYITGTNTSWCGENTVGCTTIMEKYDFRLDIITLSTGADYYVDGMESTLAHEYVHHLTTAADREWLYAHKDLYPVGSDPVEVAADCGIKHFTGVFTHGSYIDQCNAEQIEISEKIIAGTLTK